MLYAQDNSPVTREFGPSNTTKIQEHKRVSAHECQLRNELYRVTNLRSSLNDKSLYNLMRKALESPFELTNSYLKEDVDVWNRKNGRIVL